MGAAWLGGGAVMCSEKCPTRNKHNHMCHHCRSHTLTPRDTWDRAAASPTLRLCRTSKTVLVSSPISRDTSSLYTIHPWPAPCGQYHCGPCQLAMHCPRLYNADSPLALSVCMALGQSLHPSEFNCLTHEMALSFRALALST